MKLAPEGSHTAPTAPPQSTLRQSDDGNVDAETGEVCMYFCTMCSHRWVSSHQTITPSQRFSPANSRTCRSVTLLFEVLCVGTWYCCQVCFVSRASHLISSHLHMLLRSPCAYGMCVPYLVCRTHLRLQQSSDLEQAHPLPAHPSLEGARSHRRLDASLATPRPPTAGTRALRTWPELTALTAMPMGFPTTEAVH